MKAYVIKNKEGKYYQDKLYYMPNFTDNLFIANKYQSIEETKKILNKSFTLTDELQVVEITIAEGDLEQQLAEKDEELEIYKNLKRYNVGELLNENIKLRAKINTICHQVCDEIREKLKKQIIPTAGSWLSYYDIIETNNLLDQIEKGEKQ